MDDSGILCLNPSYATTRITTYRKPDDLPDRDYPISGGLRTTGIYKVRSLFELTNDVRVAAECHPYLSESSTLVSIVTVVLNCRADLEHAIDSVTSQSYSNIEYIVIDGLSTDGTLDILRSHSDRIDYWISDKDAGIYDAMNKAIELATGEWIYFLGCNDVLHNVVGDVVKEFTDSSTIYYGDVYMKFQRRHFGGPFGKYRIAFKNICHQAIFYPRSVFRKRHFSLRYPYQSDYHLNLRCYADPDIRFRYLPIEIATFSDLDSRSLNLRDENLTRDKPRLIWSLFPWYVGFPFLMWIAAIKLLEMLKVKRFVRSALERIRFRL